MIINNLLNRIQIFFRPLYEKSLILQNIDYIIGFFIFLLIFSLTFSPSDYFGYISITLIILTAVKLLTKPDEKFEMKTADKFLLIYFIFVLISLAGSTLFYLSFKGFIKTLSYLGFYIAFIHYLKDNTKFIKYIIIALLLSALGETAVAIHQNLMSVEEISGWQDMSRLNPEEVMTRVYGTLKPYNPNLFGGYLLSIFPTALISIFLPMLNKHYKTSFIGLLSLGLIAIAILLTGCRGAYIGLFAEIILLGVFTYRILKPVYKKIFRFFASIISAITFFLIVILPPLRARVYSIFAFRGDSSNSFRFNVYNSCIHMFKDNWLLGIGCGNQNFREIYGLYMKTGFDALSAYNIYLEIAVESGIFALAAFFVFLYSNLSKAIKYILKQSNAISIYLMIAVISIIGILIHGFVDTVFFRPQIQFVFWMMIGIIRVTLR